MWILMGSGDNKLGRKIWGMEPKNMSIRLVNFFPLPSFQTSSSSLPHWWSFAWAQLARYNMENIPILNCQHNHENEWRASLFPLHLSPFLLGPMRNLIP
jgi:hypothetical protein